MLVDGVRGRGWVRVFACLWPIGFLVNAGFQLWRGAVLDASLFAAAAVLMAVPWSPRLGIRPVRVPTRIAAALIPALVLFLAVAPFHGSAARALVAVMGPAALWQACAVDPAAHHSACDRSDDASRSRGINNGLVRSRRVWACWFLGLCMWEGVAFVLSRRAGDEQANPTVTVLLEPSMQSSVGRAVFAAGWLAFGIGWVFRDHER